MKSRGRRSLVRQFSDQGASLHYGHLTSRKDRAKLFSVGGYILGAGDGVEGGAGEHYHVEIRVDAVVLMLILIIL